MLRGSDSNVITDIDAADATSSLSLSLSGESVENSSTEIQLSRISISVLL